MLRRTRCLLLLATAASVSSTPNLAGAHVASEPGTGVRPAAHGDGAPDARDPGRALRRTLRNSSSPVKWRLRRGAASFIASFPSAGQIELKVIWRGTTVGIGRVKRDEAGYARMVVRITSRGRAVVRRIGYEGRFMREVARFSAPGEPDVTERQIERVRGIRRR